MPLVGPRLDTFIRPSVAAINRPTDRPNRPNRLNDRTTGQWIQNAWAPPSLRTRDPFCRWAPDCSKSGRLDDAKG